MIINGQFRWQHGPIVGVKDGAAEKLHEPRPMRIFVVVRGNMEANPSAAVFHVLFECRSLLGSLREVVEPQDQTIWLQIILIELVPVSGGVQYEVMFCCQLAVKSQGVFRSLYVIRLDVG